MRGIDGKIPAAVAFGSCCCQMLFGHYLRSFSLLSNTLSYSRNTDTIRILLTPEATCKRLQRRTPKSRCISQLWSQEQRNRLCLEFLITAAFNDVTTSSHETYIASWLLLYLCCFLLLRVKLDDVEDDLAGLFHAFKRDIFHLAVEVVAAGEDVRAWEPHE